jgi:hypothetical protein
MLWKGPPLECSIMDIVLQSQDYSQHYSLHLHTLDTKALPSLLYLFNVWTRHPALSLIDPQLLPSSTRINKDSQNKRQVRKRSGTWLHTTEKGSVSWYPCHWLLETSNAWIQKITIMYDTELFLPFSKACVTTFVWIGPNRQWPKVGVVIFQNYPGSSSLNLNRFLQAFQVQGQCINTPGTHHYVFHPCTCLEGNFSVPPTNNFQCEMSPGYIKEKTRSIYTSMKTWFFPFLYESTQATIS